LLKSYFLDTAFIEARHQRIVASAPDPVAAQQAGIVGDLTRAYFEYAYPWSFIIMLLYYPLVLLVDAQRNKQACAEFRKRNVWLEHVWAAWNLLLSVLSGIAVYYIDFAIVRTAYRSIVDGTPWFCYHQTYRYPLVPELMFLFAASKYFELLDTVFLLVLTDKPIAFLHSFHHVCTLTYVVYAAMHQETMTGHANALFGGMNVVVHTFMYLYYALQISPLTAGSLRNILRRFSPLITMLQLVQMLLGVGFCIWEAIGCENMMWRVQIPALLMYTVYFREFYLLLMTRDVEKKSNKLGNATKQHKIE